MISSVETIWPFPPSQLPRPRLGRQRRRTGARSRPSETTDWGPLSAVRDDGLGPALGRQRQRTGARSRPSETTDWGPLSAVRDDGLEPALARQRRRTGARSRPSETTDWGPFSAPEPALCLPTGRTVVCHRG